LQLNPRRKLEYRGRDRRVCDRLSYYHGAVVAQQDGAIGAQPCGDARPFLLVENDALELVEENDVLVEQRSALGDGFQVATDAAQGERGFGVGVQDAANLGAGLVDLGVDVQGRITVQRAVTVLRSKSDSMSSSAVASSKP
jgi:hypothetical protein